MLVTQRPYCPPLLATFPSSYGKAPKYCTLGTSFKSLRACYCPFPTFRFLARRVIRLRLHTSTPDTPTCFFQPPGPAQFSQATPGYLFFRRLEDEHGLLRQSRLCLNNPTLIFSSPPTPGHYGVHQTRPRTAEETQGLGESTDKRRHAQHGPNFFTSHAAKKTEYSQPGAATPVSVQDTKS